MSAIQPKTWAGNFRLLETEKGSNLFSIKPDPTGKYSAENLQAALKAILTDKSALNGWNVWADGEFGFEVPKGKPIPATMLAKLVKQADHVELVFVKRPWPQPKIKFTLGNGTGPARKAAKEAPREL